LRILVVDDEPSICEVLTRLLDAYDMDVVTSLSAAAALEEIGTGTFDVILIDLRLRDARGDALFRAAVEHQPSLRERTLFMTGDISIEAERVIASTNCPYFRKPFDITIAVQAIAARAGVTLEKRQVGAASPVEPQRTDGLLEVRSRV
jgi:DNA-binding NtrC family response regulator